jgi:hypothetical protein
VLGAGRSSRTPDASASARACRSARATSQAAWSLGGTGSALAAYEATKFSTRLSHLSSQRRGSVRPISVTAALPHTRIASHTRRARLRTCAPCLRTRERRTRPHTRLRLLQAARALPAAGGSGGVAPAFPLMHPPCRAAALRGGRSASGSALQCLHGVRFPPPHAALPTHARDRGAMRLEAGGARSCLIAHDEL